MWVVDCGLEILRACVRARVRACLLTFSVIACTSTLDCVNPKQTQSQWLKYTHACASYTADRARAHAGPPKRTAAIMYVTYDLVAMKTVPSRHT